MAGRLGGGENIGAIFDLTVDLTGDPPPTSFMLNTVEPTSLRWWFSSWSPDERRLVVSTNEGVDRAIRFYDPFAGTEVPVTGDLPLGATHPAWSPDGRTIALITNINSWGGTFSTGDVAILPVTGPDAVGTLQTIHRGADVAGATADSYPTWTPDSARIAFANGTGGRSESDQASLHIMNADGSGAVGLANASGSGTDSFQPRFSPFDSGGYYWMSFLSRRDYGNAIAGTRGAAVQQIWVTAIKKNARPGEDPSEVAYWLPGQRTATRNISAYWAPRPCRQDGDGCGVASECCSGDCRPNDSGALVCSPPPPDRCRDINMTCSRDSDCCGRLVCLNNVCTYPPL